MTKALILDKIAAELSTAERAKEAGNDGMARVCARRAAGTAISFWLEQHPRKIWGADAMGQLRSLEQDESMPAEARDAARRLAAKVTDRSSPQFSVDPLADSRTIIKHLLE